MIYSSSHNDFWDIERDRLNAALTRVKRTLGKDWLYMLYKKITQIKCLQSKLQLVEEIEQPEKE